MNENNVAEPERKKRRTKARRNYVAECAELLRNINGAIDMLQAIKKDDSPEITHRLVAIALRQLQGKANLALNGENT